MTGKECERQASTSLQSSQESDRGITDTFSLPSEANETAAKREFYDHAAWSGTEQNAARRTLCDSAGVDAKNSVAVVETRQYDRYNHRPMS